MKPILKGTRLRIKPEWQDAGDDKLTWVAIEDEDGGRVRISPIDLDLPLPPNEIVDTDMVEVEDGAPPLL